LTKAQIIKQEANKKHVFKANEKVAGEWAGFKIPCNIFYYYIVPFSIVMKFVGICKYVYTKV